MIQDVKYAQEVIIHLSLRVLNAKHAWRMLNAWEGIRSFQILGTGEVKIHLKQFMLVLLKALACNSISLNTFTEEELTRNVELDTKANYVLFVQKKQMVLYIADREQSIVENAYRLEYNSCSYLEF